MRRIALCAVVLSLVMVPAIAKQPVRIATTEPTPGSLQITARMTGEVSAEGCFNNPGPHITLAGELALGSVEGRLIFSNNRRFTHVHEEDVVSNVTLVPAGESIQFAKQPPQGGVGGNPYIYIQLLNSDWQAVSEEAFLGRCVQGLSGVDLGTLLGVDGSIEATGGSCANHPGPFISLEGELTLSGLNARLIFRNNPKGTHEHDEFVGIDLTIISEGESITFAKQPPLDGAGGNPHIYFQFKGADGNYGDAIYLGRCNRL